MDKKKHGLEELRGGSKYLMYELNITEKAGLKRYESGAHLDDFAEFVWQSAQKEQAERIAKLEASLKQIESASPSTMAYYELPRIARKALED